MLKTKILFLKIIFYKSIKLQKHKIYEAELIQLACAFYGSVELLHNGHLITNIHYPTANASLPVIIRLAKQRVDPKYKKKGRKTVPCFYLPLHFRMFAKESYSI